MKLLCDDRTKENQLGSGPKDPREERAKEAEEIKSLLRQERERTEAELRQRRRF